MSDEYILTIPSVIMLCIAARLLIFWILNIAFIPIVLSLGKKVVLGEIIKAKRESVHLNARPAFENSNPNNNNQMGYMIGAGIIRDNGQQSQNEVGGFTFAGVRKSNNIQFNRYTMIESSTPADIMIPLVISQITYQNTIDHHK